MGAGEVEVAIGRSARPEFGDWSTPAALRAARVLRRAPVAIAEELRSRLAERPVEHVREWSVSGGYVNAHLDYATWAVAVIAEARERGVGGALQLPDGFAPVPGKVLLEHTNINTNKAAHIGHLRNACLGDSVARILRRTGHQVEVHNYIDDTGVQVADVVVGLRELGMEPHPGEPFDQFCSRVYVDVSRRYEQEPDLLESRRATLHAIEARDNEIARFTKDLATRIVRAHLATMARVGIGYDVLTWESDILELGFWRAGFQLLRDSEAIVFAESGKNAGCWVLASESGDDEDADAKVLVKSDGSATYTAKDIAYQLWKFGLLGLDFHYRAWDPEDPASPATTTSSPGTDGREGCAYGHASRVVNVIDVRQAYVQRVVSTALARMGHREEAERSIHLAYEIVALSSEAARELGIDVSPERTMVAFSGRRGIEVRADDLLDLAIAKVRDKAMDEHRAALLAAGAVRYYLQQYTLTQIITFDFEEALRTTGDTGVYLQYAHARAAGVLRKVKGDGEPLVAHAPFEPPERELLHALNDYPSILVEAAQRLSPTPLTSYAFALASALSDMYEHTTPVIRETDPVVRRFRRALIEATRVTLADALTTLGIDAPDQI
jgi:arginyl-tRNA synthetase